MRAAALIAVTLLAAGGVPAPAGGAPSAACWAERMVRAERVAAARPGTVGFAVIDPWGRLWHRHGGRAHAGASLLKTTVMLAVLRRADVRARSLTRRERTLLAAMIRRSDNAAANVLIGRVGADGLIRTAARTGQRAFRLRLPLWGRSSTSAIDQARLMYTLPRHLPARHRAVAMGWLASVVPAQRWGLAAVGPAGTRIWFKGGWGSATGRVTAQAARLETGGRVWSVAVLTEFNPSHAAGVATIERLGRVLMGDGPCRDVAG